MFQVWSKEMHYTSFSAAKTAWLFAPTSLAGNARIRFWAPNGGLGSDALFGLGRLAFVPLLVATHVRRSSRQSVHDSLSCMGDCPPRPLDTSGKIRDLAKKLRNAEISCDSGRGDDDPARENYFPFHHSHRAWVAQ
jgi:hypothetical protein